MNKLYLLLSMVILSLITVPSQAQTNQTLLENATGTLQRNVSTNLNDVIVDILRGAKNASGEIYDASKQAITKSVDFTMEQAPLVVTEFLHWNLAEAIIRFSIWLTPAAILLTLAHVLRKRSEDPKVPVEDGLMFFDQTGSGIFKWLLRIIAIVLIMINVSTNGMTVAKIIIAPRVYLIEYVVNALHPSTRQ